jgi:hypothetical protein
MMVDLLVSMYNIYMSTITNVYSAQLWRYIQQIQLTN